MKVCLALIILASSGLAQINQIGGGVAATDVRTNPPVYPETYGASPGASAATNLAAIQNAIYAAFGCGNSIACRTNGSGLQSQNRPLVLTGIYHINGELKLYHVSGFEIAGSNKLLSGIVQDATNSRIFDGQCIAYGTIHDLNFSTTVSQTTPLIDLDNDHTHGADLSPQNITFRDVAFAGNNAGADVGLLISKHGGDAQGDNIRCEFCYFSGFSGAGLQVGGNNTGRNAGRFYATNALIDVIGGDFQGNPLYGIASYSGGVYVNGPTMENESSCAQFGCQTGFDVYNESNINGCTVENIRSESHKLAGGGGCTVRNSYTIFQAAQWYSASRGSSLAGTNCALNQIISGTGIGGDGAYYQCTVAGTFGGLGITTANGGSSTTVTVPGTPWTVNAFTGYRATLITGSGSGQYCVVTSNTSSAITCSGGWVTNYVNSAISPWTFVNPDATTTFVVEPNWGTQTTSGAVTFAAFNFNAIDGDAGALGQGETLDNVGVPGGQIHALGNFKNVRVSRTDWLNASFPLDDTIVNQQYSQVYLVRPDAGINVNGTTQKLTWAFSRNGGGASAYTDWSQVQVGGMTQVWSHGGAGGGSAVEDSWVGLNGFRLPTFTFSTLPASAPYNANGVAVYCKDCNSTCSAGSSTGRTCFRENGAWTH